MQDTTPVHSNDFSRGRPSEVKVTLAAAPGTHAARHKMAQHIAVRSTSAVPSKFSATDQESKIQQAKARVLRTKAVASSHVRSPSNPFNALRPYDTRGSGNERALPNLAQQRCIDVSPSLGNRVRPTWTSTLAAQRGDRLQK